MKIVYYSYGRADSAIIAAALHRKRLAMRGIPEIDELLSLPEFWANPVKAAGILYLNGPDEDGNLIYCMGIGADRNLALQTAFHTLQSFPEPFNPQEWKFYNTVNLLGGLAKMAEFMQILHVRKADRYLIAVNLRRVFPALVTMVEGVKEWNRIGQAQSHCIDRRGSGGPAGR